MKIVLLSYRLSFMRLASGKIHAHDAKWNHATMCGKDIAAATTPCSYRSASSTEVCKRCAASLRTYTGGTARLNATPLVRFEDAEVSA